jgi:dolichyl-phosphate beta-glucosyltransferase
MSVVVPAYNEEERLPGMLEEAVDFLEREYGTDASKLRGNGAATKKEDVRRRQRADGAGGADHHHTTATGWEIIIVSDGSSDRTVSTALEFARSHVLSADPKPVPGPRTPNPGRSTHIPPGSIRVIELEKNRGKGGAVTHGMKYVRGKYAIFADADGATKFSDLAKMVTKAEELEGKDKERRAVIVGSRAHLVGSEAVVKVCPMASYCVVILG